MSRQLANPNCPICLHPERRRIDSELIEQIDAGHEVEEIFDHLLRDFFPAHDIDIALGYDAFRFHMNKHPKLGMVGDSAIRSANVVMLPSGERIDVSNVESVLRNFIAVGMINLLTNPDSITPTHTLRAAEMLLKLKGQGGDVEELMNLIRDKLVKPSPPADTENNPYAAPPK